MSQASGAAALALTAAASSCAPARQALAAAPPLLQRLRSLVATSPARGVSSDDGFACSAGGDAPACRTVPTPAAHALSDSERHDGLPASACHGGAAPAPSTSGRPCLSPGLSFGFAAAAATAGAVQHVRAGLGRCFCAACAGAGLRRAYSTGAQPGTSSPAEGSSDGGGGGRRTGPPPPLPTHDVVYHGPLSSQHRLLKRISLTNTAIALAAAPAIVEYADSISYAARMGLAGSMVAFGIFTTAALHWVAHPYVHELRYCAATQDITATTATLFGTKTQHTFNLKDVSPLPWNRPVATFTALGRFYYIDVYSFPEDAAGLLARLAPNDAPEGYKDDDDDD